MSPAESLWWSNKLNALPTDAISPLINIGSSTEHYRKVTCPYIDKNIFRPLKSKGVKVVHLDLKEGSGVDVIGDVTTPSVQREILPHSPRAILCTNFLEHVVDRDLVCTSIGRLLPVGGLAMISVPRSYPYHPDPIDTRFRPDATEIAQAMQKFVMKDHAEIAFGNYLDQILSKPWLVARDSFLLVGGVTKRDRWRVLFSNYGYLVRNFSVTCAILEKTE